MRRFFAGLSSFVPVRSALKSKLFYVIELDIGKDDCSGAALSAGGELCGFFAEADSSLFVDGDDSALGFLAESVNHANLYLSGQFLRVADQDGAKWNACNRSVLFDGLGFPAAVGRGAAAGENDGEDCEDNHAFGVASAYLSLHLIAPFLSNSDRWDNLLCPPI